MWDIIMSFYGGIWELIKEYYIPLMVLIYGFSAFYFFEGRGVRKAGASFLLYLFFVLPFRNPKIWIKLIRNAIKIFINGIAGISLVATVFLFLAREINFLEMLVIMFGVGIPAMFFLCLLGDNEAKEALFGKKE